MKNIYIFLFAFAAALTACKSDDATKTAEQSATTPAAATVVVAPTDSNAVKAGMPPFAISDSSKVMNLEGGVKLYILQQGQGLAAKVENKVLAHYNGRLRNGGVFDSSYERGAPAEFPLANVIKGWQVAFQQLKPGAKAVIVIPPAMGYGEQSQAKIPANSTLIFDVEFITTM